MANPYYEIENKVSRENNEENKRKAQEEKVIELEELLNGIMKDPQMNGLTDEEVFLARYYGLNQEKIEDYEYNIPSYEHSIKNMNEETRGKLENERYEAAIDMYSSISIIDNNINQGKDRFHKEIKEWNDYLEGFSEEPLIIKKMRNLQLLNRIAHQYETIFKNIIYYKNPEIGEYNTDKNKEIIEHNIKELYSTNSEDRLKAEKRLSRKFEKEKIEEWKDNEELKFCMNASKWMFKQKEMYIEEVLGDLQKNNVEYNYGRLDNGFVFEVPEYGQFGVHMGVNNKVKTDELTQKYEVGPYKGKDVENICILYKADPELVKSAKYEELSEKEKQTYKILNPEFREEYINENEQEIQEVEESTKEQENQEIKENEKLKEAQRYAKGIIDNQEGIELINQIIEKRKEQKRIIEIEIQRLDIEINEKILGENNTDIEQIIKTSKELLQTLKTQRNLKKEIEVEIEKYEKNIEDYKKENKKFAEKRNQAIEDIELDR